MDHAINNMTYKLYILGLKETMVISYQNKVSYNQLNQLVWEYDPKELLYTSSDYLSPFKITEMQLSGYKLFPEI